MANYTENYQLEKPLPEEFYDVGVQNGNMDKIDAAIAAIDGAKAGEKGDLADDDALPLVDSADSSKTKRVLWSTVKTALANLFVPLTRKVNGKALSEDLTLTGEDIKVSGSDETSISSSLSNKLGIPTEIKAGQNLDHYVVPGLYFCGELAQSVDNIPPDSITGAFSLFVEKTGAYGNGVKQTFTEHNPGFTYIRLLSDTSMNHWSDWKLIANATPPQEYDLPLVDGISGTAKYSKDQFGIVRVHMAAVKDSGTITNNEILGTLPEGFRPKLSLAVVGYGNSNPNTISDRHTVNMYISSNGDITASFLSETDAAKLASLYGVTEFIAAS